MNIVILEPYYTGSHAAWVSGLSANSRHTVEVLKLGGAYWKWRMHGGAVTLSRRFLESGLTPDLIVATDMLDLTTFQALTRSRTAGVPMAVYFHENQLSYPWSPTDRDVLHGRDRHYGFINFASALAADAVYFNSAWHLASFFDGLERLLKNFPDYNELGGLDALRARSSVLHLGIDLSRFDRFSATLRDGGTPLVVWNHRWEYDKNPDLFFKVLRRLASRGLPFELAVLGENFARVPVQFIKARGSLGERVVQFGYAGDFGEYARWLFAADCLPVTSHQDFFGTSVVEAVYCGCRPLLPRRLAYPELIPEKHQSDVFYDDDNEFEERLEALLAGPRRRAGNALKEAMARFDWERIAPLYDDAFEALAGV